MNLKEVGNRLKTRRKAMGISQAEVARRAKIGRSTLRYWEDAVNPKTGESSQPSKDGLERLMNVLDMNPVDQIELMNLAGYSINSQPVSTTKQPILTLDDLFLAIQNEIRIQFEEMERKLNRLH